MPPEKPCSARQATSAAKPVLRAQPSEAKVKHDTATTNSQRVDSTRVSTPVSGIAITSATR